MHISQISDGVRTLLFHTKQDSFIYDLLTAYGKPKASVTRLQAGEYNISKDKDYVLWKSNVYFTNTGNHAPAQILEQMKQAEPVKKHKPRFIIATNFEKFCAYDTKTEELLDIDFVEIASKFDFFLPWAGMEKSKQTTDSPADVKAAEKMAKLYDLILELNPVRTEEERHRLNVFLSRLLFCYFAEDTAIFALKLFSKSIESHTSADGSDLAEYLQGLFKVLDEESRDGTPSYYKKFPYVNGGLFEKHVPVPAFNKRSRELLIRCGLDLDWSEINPDIFGSMFQAVVDVEQRGNMGMHYTSYENIMKVIEPLFLNDLDEERDRAKGSQKKLEDLLSRLTQIRVFDPACGSGNFLIIAYKELRKLEMKIVDELSNLKSQSSFAFSGIQLSQFSGIELDDFAHEIAKLALWLAEHQMNIAFLKKFNTLIPSLPLKPTGNIVRGNSLSMPWTDICANANEDVYILGNPPYLGARNQDEEQKADLERIFEGHPDYKDSDYVTGWLLKAAQFIESTSCKFAFVTTNSICQGEQVSYIWPRLYARGLEIGFAHQAFKWTNNAKKNAGVTCVIAGVRAISKKPKHLINSGTVATVQNISPYLTAGTDTCVARTSERLSDLPEMMIGSMARDGGNLIMTEDIKEELIKQYPLSLPLLKMLTGTNEFIKGHFRWCLWIEDKDLTLALSIPPIKKRIDAVRKFRTDSKAKTTNEYAKIPHKFAQRCYRELASIVVPSTTSERRTYIPIGYLSPGVVITNSANAIYDASTFLFGLVSSKMHMVWVRSIGGQLESRLRYSAEIVYNTFPVPTLSGSQKKAVESAALQVLYRREQHSDLSIEDLYDPDTMPEDLSEAHAQLDRVADSIYRNKPFNNDEERLGFLLEMYEEMMENHNA